MKPAHSGSQETLSSDPFKNNEMLSVAQDVKLKPPKKTKNVMMKGNHKNQANPCFRKKRKEERYALKAASMVTRFQPMAPYQFGFGAN